MEAPIQEYIYNMMIGTKKNTFQFELNNWFAALEELDDIYRPFEKCDEDSKTHHETKNENIQELQENALRNDREQDVTWTM